MFFKSQVVIAAFVAVAAAYPAEEVRAKRSAILASGALVQGPQAILAGPSGKFSFHYNAHTLTAYSLTL